MKNLVILGAGTAGTLVANQIHRRLPSGWTLSVIDPELTHLYQPDLIFVPFGMRDDARLTRARATTLRRGVRWVRSAVRAVDTDRREVVLTTGRREPYDLLVVASGSYIRPDETPGLDGEHWRRSAHDFYTLDGAVALREALRGFRGGRLVLNIVEMPIKCPVAPLEFMFLAHEYFTRRGVRDQVELVYVTPLDGAFTRPIASRLLGSLLEDRGIRVETEFNTGEVDGDARVLRSYDEREVPYDLLVSIPTHKGAPFVEESGLGNELDFVPTDPKTLAAREHAEIFVVGDAADLPTSKAGSVAHFQGKTAVENLVRAMQGRSPVETFDGHANCFVETGFGRALLVDFNYDTEPLPGSFPLPVVGPFPLMRESRRNHWGKLGFRWMYWNALLPGRPIPVTHHMSMVGKQLPLKAAAAAADEGDSHASS